MRALSRATRCAHRAFAESLVVAAPAPVAHDVDDRRPAVQAVVVPGRQHAQARGISTRPTL